VDKRHCGFILRVNWNDMFEQVDRGGLVVCVYMMLQGPWCAGKKMVWESRWCVREKEEQTLGRLVVKR
jgi:hypothetical protein